MLDLACALAQWLSEPTRDAVIYPVEQSAIVRIEPGPDSSTIRSGRKAVRLPIDVVIEAFGRLLEMLATDLSLHAPRIREIPGFEWVRDASRPADLSHGGVGEKRCREQFLGQRRDALGSTEPAVRIGASVPGAPIRDCTAA